MTSPAVLFLHGWGGSFRSSFEAHGWTAAPAIARRSMIAMNLPGHADPEASIDPAAYNDLAALVASELPDQPMDIIGYSLGAKIALALATAKQVKVRRLALFGVGDNIFAPEPAAETVIDALENGITSDTPPIAMALVEYSKASRSKPAALAAVLRRPINPIIDQHALAKLGTTTILVNSADDNVAQPDNRLRCSMPGLTYLQVQGPSHIALPRNAEVIAHCTNFLSDANHSNRSTANAVDTFN